MTDVLRLGETLPCLDDVEISRIAPLAKGDLGLREVLENASFSGVDDPRPIGASFIEILRAGAAGASSAVSLIECPKVAVWFVLTDPELPSVDST